MASCHGRAVRAVEPFDLEEAERLMLWTYTALPLLPQAEDGSRSAALARSGNYEVRITEFPSDRMPFLPLWIELISVRTRQVLQTRGFSDIDDATHAVHELVAEARERHKGILPP